jgi:aminoglycoside phosphotransferase (APT) family kinase protein
MEEKLSAFLKNQMPVAADLAIRGLQRRPGGASRESWAFEVAWRENGKEFNRSCILRRDPTGSVMEGEQTNRSLEFRVLKALESTPVCRNQFITPLRLFEAIY